jgi:hypothetical protein
MPNPKIPCPAGYSASVKYPDQWVNHYKGLDLVCKHCGRKASSGSDVKDQHWDRCHVRQNELAPHS